MRYQKTRPGEVVTSPILAGDAAQVEKMRTCEPHEFTNHYPWVAVPDLAKVETRLETCRKCQCSRSRIRGPEDTIEKNFPDGAEV